MKKAIYLLALILGMSGTAAAQSCGGGYYSGNGSSYYNAVEAVGKVNITKRGFLDRLWVTQANIIKKRGNRLTLEYVFTNGDVLTIMTKRRANGFGHGHHDEDDFYYPSGVSNGNNYYYGASSNNWNNRGATFDVHCVRLNGRTINNNCGTITIERGYGSTTKTFIDLDLRRLGQWRGNADVFRGRGRF